MIYRVLAAVAVITFIAAPAHAQEMVTSQARAIRGEFLVQATPPTPAAVICMVDTGVDVTPDTAGVVDRLALDGGPTTDQSPSRHGSTIAAYMGAPVNGFGMIGIWPAARIVSVRANVVGQDAFPVTGYVFGMKRCNTHALRQQIKVVLLALSSPSPMSSEARVELADEIAAAQRDDVSVVVAAGNSSGGPVSSPADFAGVLAIGGAQPGNGLRCAVSAVGAALLAPGCGLEGSDPLTGQATSSHQGTSYSAAIAAATLAALRTWRPDLTADAARQLLESTAVATADGKRIDATAAFNAAGLGALTGSPSAPPAPAPPSTPQPPAKPKRLPKPQFSVQPRGSGSRQTLRVRLTNRPRGADVTVRVFVRARGGKYRRVTSRSARSSIVTLRARSWHRVTARFSDPSGQRRASLTAVRVRR